MSSKIESNCLNTTYHRITLWGFVVIAIISRLLPHPPNASAILPLTLLFGVLLPKKQAVVLLMSILIISNFYLSYVHHDSLIGWWTFFSYSGFTCLLWWNDWWQPRGQNLLSMPYLLSASFFYWTWTNLGVWCSADMYPKTLHGLLQCYFLALPFLGTQIGGDIGWMFIFLSCLFLSQRPQLARQSLRLLEKF